MKISTAGVTGAWMVDGAGVVLAAASKHSGGFDTAAAGRECLVPGKHPLALNQHLPHTGLVQGG